MKSLSRSTLCLFLVLGIAAAATVVAQAPQPKVVAPEPVIDLGKTPRGAKSTATFTIENQGSATLTFGDVSEGCRCTDVQAPDIAAGASGEVLVTVDTLKMSGPAAVRVQIATNDPETPSIQLTVKVFSQDMLVSHPGYYRYLVHQNFTGEGKLRQVVAATDNADFEITKIDVPYPFLRVGEVQPAAEEERIPKLTGSQWAFEVQLDNKADVGALSGNVEVHTTHPSQKTMPIPLSGFVRPVSAFTPVNLGFGRFTPQPMGYKEIHFKQFGTEPVEITEISANLEGFTFEPVVQEEGRSWKIRVFPSVELSKGPFRGTVTLKTTSIYEPTTTFEIAGFVE